jgi:hypothetical protein
VIASKRTENRTAARVALWRLVRLSSFYNLVLAEIEVLSSGHGLRDVRESFTTCHVLDGFAVNGPIRVGNRKTKIAGWPLPHKNPSENCLIRRDIPILGYGLKCLVSGLHYILGINTKEYVIFAKKRLPHTLPITIGGLLLKRGRDDHQRHIPKIGKVNDHGSLDMNNLGITVDPNLCPALRILSPRKPRRKVRGIRLLV